ncbi:hypothetical protein ACX0G9_27750 [Flavitalea flava]
MNLTKITAVLVLSVFGMSACTKNVTNRVDQVFSAVYTIQPGDWVVDNTNFTNTVNLTVPELDDVINQSGGVLVYLSFNINGVWSDYEQVPDVLGAESYRVTHSLHTVTIESRPTDTGTNFPIPGTVKAKVVLLDATNLN